MPLRAADFESAAYAIPPLRAEAPRHGSRWRIVRAMADLLLLGFIAGFVRGGWSTGFLRRLVGLAYIALSFVVGAYLRQPVGAIVAGIFPQIPEAYAEMGSIEFATLIVKECDVAVSPGVGFGPAGDKFVRFALIENEKRIQQAIRNLKRGLPKLG